MLIDATLREGAQMYAVQFSQSERRAIARGLADLGVEEIEAGWIGQPGLADFLAWARTGLRGPALSVWSRCRKEDVLQACSLGAERINVGVPASREHRQARLGLSRRALGRRVESLARLGRGRGAAVSIGLEDASRADRADLFELAAAAQAGGAFRVRLSDTVGVWSPAEAGELAAAVCARTDCEVGVHCHDDFGMGTANAVAALEAGAEWADATLLGLGERAGLAATEEIAAYFVVQKQRRDYALEGLADLCALTAQAAGIAIPRNKAVAGEDIFACETGVHLHAMARAPALFEPYAPERVSARRLLRFGAKSGGAALHWLRQSGHAAGANVLDRVRLASAAAGRPLSLQECVAAAKETRGGEG